MWLEGSVVVVASVADANVVVWERGAIEYRLIIEYIYIYFV